MNAVEQLSRIEQKLAAENVRLTMQRRLVVERMVRREHFTAEEMVKDVQKMHPSIARGTVYRTLALLQDNGLAEKHDFKHQAPYYELTHGRKHHDHLICLNCGEIIEFHNSKLEAMQEAIVNEYGYELISHSHKLYGLCAKCQRQGKDTARKPPKLHVTEVVE